MEKLHKKNSIYWLTKKIKPKKKHQINDKLEKKFKCWIWNKTAYEELNNNKRVLNNAKPKGEIKVIDNIKAES